MRGAYEEINAGGRKTEMFCMNALEKRLLAIGTSDNGHILGVPHVSLHKLPQKHAARRLGRCQSLTVRHFSNGHCHL